MKISISALEKLEKSFASNKKNSSWQKERRHGLPDWQDMRDGRQRAV